MDLDAYFDLVETPAFMFWGLWFCGAIVATAIIWGVLRAAGRGE